MVQLYIVPMDTFKESLRLADTIRNFDIKVEVEMKNKKVKKALDYANRVNISYVIVLGENEINEGKIKLKEMSTGKEYEISLDNISEINKVIL